MECVEPEASSLLIEETAVTSVLEFAPDKLLVVIQDGSDLLIVDKWTQIKTIKEPSLANNGKYWLAKMPGFDEETFPFCITHGNQTFNLINMKQGSMEILVKAYGKNRYG